MVRPEHLRRLPEAPGPAPGERRFWEGRDIDAERLRRSKARKLEDMRDRLAFYEELDRQRAIIRAREAQAGRPQAEPVALQVPIRLEAAAGRPEGGGQAAAEPNTRAGHGAAKRKWDQAEPGAEDDPHVRARHG